MSAAGVGGSGAGAAGTDAGAAGEVCVLRPDWPVPAQVQAAFSLRAGGVSAGPWASLNLGAHVGDDPSAVRENRRRLAGRLALPAEPVWLTQVHGAGVAGLGAEAAGLIAPGPLTADAAVTRRAGVVCAILVADCLPVLLAARDGSVIGAAHAGWRGLAAGVLEAAVARMEVPPEELLAWVGPGIGRDHFEVGAEVRAAFTGADPGADAAFAANARGRWQCDLAGLAQRRLARAGVTAVYGGSWCTWADAGRFFSHRRDGQCGRMAALIWKG